MSVKTLSPTVRAAIPVAVTIGLLVWLVSHVDFRGFSETVRHADHGWFVLAVIVSIVTNVTIPVAKWRGILVRMDLPISFRDTLVAYLGCFPFRFATPMKVGEFLKAVYLERRRGFPFAESLSSVAFDKATNIAVVTAFAIVGTAVFDYGLNRPALLAALVPLFAVLSSSRLQRGILPLTRRIHGKAGELVERLLAAFHEIPPARRRPIWGLTILMAFMEGVVYALCAQTMGLDVPFVRVLFGMPLVILSANMPVTVSGLGMRETAVVYLFSAFGPPEKLLAWGVCVSLIDVILIVVLGLPFVGPFAKGALDSRRERAAPGGPRCPGV